MRWSRVEGARGNPALVIYGGEFLKDDLVVPLNARSNHKWAEGQEAFFETDEFTLAMLCDETAKASETA